MIVPVQAEHPVSMQGHNEYVIPVLEVYLDVCLETVGDITKQPLYRS